MKIFISSSILQFKTRFIPGGCLILPMPSFIGANINTIVAKLKLIKHCEIICENQRIFKAISPYFKENSVIMDYSNGIEYCGSPIKNKMNYAVISAYFCLFIYALVLDNFIQAFFLTLIYLIIFFAVILWFSDREEWQFGSKRIIHV